MCIRGEAVSSAKQVASTRALMSVASTRVATRHGRRTARLDKRAVGVNQWAWHVPRPAGQAQMLQRRLQLGLNQMVLGIGGGRHPKRGCACSNWLN